MGYWVWYASASGLPVLSLKVSARIQSDELLEMGYLTHLTWWRSWQCHWTQLYFELMMHSIRYSGLPLMMRGRGSGWLQLSKVFGYLGSSCEMWNTGWIQMVEGSWRVKDMADGWETMGKGLIFFSANFQAVWFIWIWSIHMNTLSLTQNGRGHMHSWLADWVMASWASFIWLWRKQWILSKLIAKWQAWRSVTSMSGSSAISKKKSRDLQRISNSPEHSRDISILQRYLNSPEFYIYSRDYNNL